MFDTVEARYTVLVPRVLQPGQMLFSSQGADGKPACPSRRGLSLREGPTGEAGRPWRSGLEQDPLPPVPPGHFRVFSPRRANGRRTFTRLFCLRSLFCHSCVVSVCEGAKVCHGVLLQGRGKRNTPERMLRTCARRGTLYQASQVHPINCPPPPQSFSIHTLNAFNSERLNSVCKDGGMNRTTSACVWSSATESLVVHH